MSSDDSAGFTAAYDANYADVLRYVQRRAPASHVDDVVADTFAVAWRRRGALPPEPRAWLFRTASNVMKSTARRESRQQTLAVRAWEPGAGISTGAGTDVDSSLDLITAWRGLSRKDQEAIALHAWEELTDTEAATVLGCTRATYTMRLTRAKRRLAQLMNPAHEPAIAERQLQPREGTS
ncbi:RNA polymerase sigma factor [Herbiconiux sp. VKM Ac-1786]|uniref:RNA polymerase sigma factor n=1 Tax=Herbiconiux sp. VKM Ac-1786 TaxID=2783824 RepID=UPI00188BB6BF|nr:RNA polymerase sigma factor [Herbiconiux sp. VKM Ac-1786]MBF4571168.1 RNA polymerase sigma factor [Herbiconiux sp. VKM Ac-1786]